MATHSVPRTLPPFLTQDKAKLHEKFTDLEWLQRDRLSMALQTSTTSSPSKYTRLTGEAIASRNRYLNVEPFASNRVKLRVPGGAPNDYINASPILLGEPGSSSPPRKYIATQGPKEAGIAHFYRMLSAETKNPTVVVMLTQTHEGGKEKCFRYFPVEQGKGSVVKLKKEEGMGDGFEGEVELVAVREDGKSRSQVRELRLRTGDGAEREIRHILFSGWPDFLVPEGEDREALIELVRLSAGLCRRSEGEQGEEGDMAECLAGVDPENPRIVHCSAGVGRSGTFIALDYLLSLLHAGKLDEVNPDPEYDPICDLVDNLRCQRMMMVQGESQFMFLYEVLREQFQERIRQHHPQNGGSTSG